MYLHTVIGIKDFCKYATSFTLLFISGQRIKANKILICFLKLTLEILYQKVVLIKNYIFTLN